MPTATGSRPDLVIRGRWRRGCKAAGSVATCAHLTREERFANNVRASSFLRRAVQRSSSADLGSGPADKRDHLRIFPETSAGLARSACQIHPAACASAAKNPGPGNSRHPWTSAPSPKAAAASHLKAAESDAASEAANDVQPHRCSAESIVATAWSPLPRVRTDNERGGSTPI